MIGVILNEIGSHRKVLSTKVIWPGFYFQKIPLTLLEDRVNEINNLASAGGDSN